METQEEESLYRLLCSNDLAQVKLGLQLCSGTRPDILSSLSDVFAKLHEISRWTVKRKRSGVSNLEYATNIFDFMGIFGGMRLPITDLSYRDYVLKLPKPISCRVNYLETTNHGKTVFHDENHILNNYTLSGYVGDRIDFNGINAKNIYLKNCEFNVIAGFSKNPCELYLRDCKISVNFFDSYFLQNVTDLRFDNCIGITEENVKLFAYGLSEDSLIKMIQIDRGLIPINKGKPLFLGR